MRRLHGENPSNPSPQPLDVSGAGSPSSPSISGLAHMSRGTLLERGAGFADRLPRWIGSLLLLVAALRAYAHRHVVDADAIAYLDLSDRVLALDGTGLLNGYWQPGYPILLALTRLALGRDPEIEFAAAHALSFASFAFALLCFARFASVLLRVDAMDASGNAPLPTWAVSTSAFLLFGWTALEWTSLAFVTPDLLVSGISYLVASECLLLSNIPSSPWRGAGVGLLLAAGSLLKSVLFPLSAAVLAALMLERFRRRLPSWRAIAIAAAAFAAVASIYVAPLSLSKGRFAFGDQGLLNYAWLGNGVKLLSHWQGDDPRNGVPEHPTRRIHRNPDVFEFNGPVGGTYPTWFDPSYWHEGLVLRFDPARQLARVVATTYQFARILLNGTGNLGAAGTWMWGLLALVVVGTHPRLSMGALSRKLAAVLFAASALFGYWLVHVQSRYIASFVTILLLCLLSSLRFRRASARGSRLVVLTMLLIWSSAVASLVLTDLARIFGDDQGVATETQFAVARGLNDIGIPPGTKIAFVGNAFAATWPRMGRVHIVGEVQQWHVTEFWRLPPGLRSEIYVQLRNRGVEAIVSESMPPSEEDEWREVGASGHYLRKLQLP